MHPQSLAVLQPGAVFHGRYRVQRCIKAGGMGAVYEIVDENTDSARALKVMLPSLVADKDHRARFALEARVTGGIESDHLVRVSDAGIDEPTSMPFLVMDLLRGEELAQLLERRRMLTAGEVVLYLHQASLALDKTHAAGIVHRDLKPENLFLTHRDDGSPCMKILDFGIAKVVQQNHGADTTRALGTPLYMSPEQIRGVGTIGPRADLYALAQIAYTLLAGEPYWAEDAKGAETLFPLLAKIVAGAAEPASMRARRRTGAALPATFDAWYFKATAPGPDARFDRATTQVLALAQAAGIASPTPSLSAAVPVVTGAVPPPGVMAYAPASRRAPLSSGTLPMGPPSGMTVPSGPPSSMTVPTAPPSSTAVPMSAGAFPPRADSGPTPAAVAVTASVTAGAPVPAATVGAAAGTGRRGVALVLVAVALMAVGGVAAAVLFGTTVIDRTTAAPSASALSASSPAPAAPTPATSATTAPSDAAMPAGPDPAPRASAAPSAGVPRHPGAPAGAYPRSRPVPPSPEGPPKHEGIF